MLHRWPKTQSQLRCTNVNLVGLKSTEYVTGMVLVGYNLCVWLFGVYTKPSYYVIFTDLKVLMLSDIADET